MNEITASLLQLIRSWDKVTVLTLLGTALLLDLIIFVAATIYYHRRGDGGDVLLTDDEQEEQQREAERIAEEKRLMDAIWKEARYLATEIPNQLAIQNEMAFRYNEEATGRKKRRKRLIKFPVGLLTSTEIWFAFDGRHLPYGTSFYDIKNPNNHVVENLQYAIHRPVSLYEDEEFNLFLRVGLKNAIMGIPKLVRWQDVHDQLPASRPFAVAAGVTNNSRLVYQDFRTWPHIFLAGSSDMGKSTQLKSWICSLILRNRPEDLQFYFIDLKHGLELGEFATLPHCAGFAKEPGDAAALVNEAVARGLERLGKFEGKARNLQGWNSQFPHLKEPYVIVVIDELFDLMTSKDLKKEMIAQIGVINRKLRAAGVHNILCTQIVNRQVADIQIIGNAPARCVFSLPGLSQSMLALNNGQATTLNDHRGRAIYRGVGGSVTVQAPWITEKEIKETIQHVMDGYNENIEFTLNDLWQLILTNLGGIAAYRNVRDAVMGEISEYKLKKWLKGSEFDVAAPEQGIITVDGQRYILATTRTKGAMRQPRRLLPVDDYLPATTDELHDLYMKFAAPEPVPASGSEEPADVGSPENGVKEIDAVDENEEVYSDV